MKTLALLLAVLALAPLQAQEAAPQAQAVSYQEAVDCATVALSLGLILSDRDNENATEESLARGRAFIALLEPFTRHAESVGGKPKDAVFDDIGTAMEALAGKVQANTLSASEFRAMGDVCVAKAELL